MSEKQILSTTYLIVKKLLANGYSISFAVGACAAIGNNDAEPDLFAERIANLNAMKIDLEDYVKGFHFYRTMEALNV